MRFGLFLGLWLAWLGSDCSASEFYLSLQAGASVLSGPGTETYASQDCNPYALPYDISDTRGVLRLALGVRSGQWGLELGYGRLGGYQRTLQPAEGVVWDTVGEVVATQAADLRVARYFAAGRWQPYVYGSLAAVTYQREVWTGHRTVGGVLISNFEPGNIHDVYAQWQKSSGMAFGYGAGLGVEYRVSDRWSVTGEVGALFGEFAVHSATLGLKLRI